MEKEMMKFLSETFRVLENGKIELINKEYQFLWIVGGVPNILTIKFTDWKMNILEKWYYDNKPTANTNPLNVNTRSKGFYWIKWSMKSEWEIARYEPETDKFYYTNGSKSEPSAVNEIDEQRIIKQ